MLLLRDKLHTKTNQFSSTIAVSKRNSGEFMLLQVLSGVQAVLHCNRMNHICPSHALLNIECVA